MKVAIIGGSALEELFAEGAERRQVLTKYGKVELSRFMLGNVEVFFLPRHGLKHEHPPHKVNYRANILALRTVGVERIIATNAVGSLREEIKPGTFVVPHQLVDFSKTRHYTFFDNRVVHVDFTEPFCNEVRAALLRACEDVGAQVTDHGVYVCCEGPRFETAAEIEIFRKLGCDIVGMTSSPEAILARELGMCYASLSVVTNFAAGMQHRVSHEEVVELMAKVIPKVKGVVAKAAGFIPESRNCLCKDYWENFELIE